MVPGASVVTVQIPENAINNSVQGETTATAKAIATTLCVGPAGLRSIHFAVYITSLYPAL